MGCQYKNSELDMAVCCNTIPQVLDEKSKTGFQICYAFVTAEIHI